VDACGDDIALESQGSLVKASQQGDRQEFRHGGGSRGDLGHDRKTSVPRFMKNLKQVQNFRL
jgi:hypothetical protein